jgi:hypothetical protein
VVPISGTPNGNRILVLFQIPGILVGFFFMNSAVEKSSNLNYNLQNSELW